MKLFARGAGTGYRSGTHRYLGSGHAIRMSQGEGVGLILWMDEPLHHSDIYGVAHCWLVFTAESSFPKFLGGSILSISIA